MINHENKNKIVTNKKSGFQGSVVCDFNRLSDGKHVVEVTLFNSMKTTYWLASNVDGLE